MEYVHLQPPLNYMKNNYNYNYNYYHGNENYNSVNMGEKMVQRKKWLKHYSSNDEILLVGDGDFSFSLSLALAFDSASNIFATSIDSYDSLISTYKKARKNLQWLRVLGATIVHEVDARKMKDHRLLSSRKFDFIIYNFPHAGFYGKEDNPDMIKMHQGLVYDFFSNARCLLRHNGEIHVTHKTKPPYSSWNLEELARKNNLNLKECVPFDIKDYPSYENKRGHGSTIDEPFDWRDSCTYKFTATPLYYNIYDYFDVNSSSHLNQLSSRETLPRVKFIVKAEVRLNPKAAGYAGALVDENQSTQALFYGPLPYMDVNVAALLAIKCALLMFERSSLCKRNVALDIECDSNIAISWVRSQFGNPRELFEDLQDITMALGRIKNQIEFCFGYREYGAKPYLLVCQLAVEALDARMLYEKWLHARD